MGVIGEWVWIRLCLVEVLHTCEIPPALVAPHLFHHVNHVTVNSKLTLMSPAPSMILTMSQRFPQTTREGEGRWEGSRERLRRGTHQMARKPEVEAGVRLKTERKTCLQELALPAEGEPVLSHVNKAHVKNPESCHDGHVGCTPHYHHQPGRGAFR